MESNFELICKGSKYISVIEPTNRNQINVFISENGYGSCNLKLNESDLILINGMTEKQYQNFIQDFNINKSIYKNTDTYTFVEKIKTLYNVSEKSGELYENKFTGMYSAYRKLKGMPDELFKIKIKSS